MKDDCRHCGEPTTNRYCCTERYENSAAKEASSKYKEMRDRCIGSIYLLVHDGVISMGRARELIGMDIYQQREEFKRISDNLESEG